MMTTRIEVVDCNVLAHAYELCYSAYCAINRMSCIHHRLDSKVFYLEEGVTHALYA